MAHENRRWPYTKPLSNCTYADTMLFDPLLGRILLPAFSSTGCTGGYSYMTALRSGAYATSKNMKPTFYWRFCLQRQPKQEA
jgi:hypothetical protein